MWYLTVFRDHIEFRKAGCNSWLVFGLVFFLGERGGSGVGCVLHLLITP